MKTSAPNPGEKTFEEFRAALLYCNQCKQAMPVKQRLLLVLPDGELYDYTCERCGSSVGSKTERAPVAFDISKR